MVKITIEHVIDLDYEEVCKALTSFIKGFVASSNCKGVVVGVSGGVDSATTLALLVNALGANRVIALILPDTRVTPDVDVEDALKLAKQFGVDYKIYKIDSIVDAYLATLGKASKKTVGNLRARIRMSILYYVANEHNLLVAGAGDRSELLIGYFTKYGDSGVDFLPIGVLYKSQVRRLAKHLGVPDNIAFKPSAPRLWEGHEAEKELGLRYEDIDVALFALFDLKLPISKAAEATGLPREVFERILHMYFVSEHKRSPLPMPNIEVVYRVWRGYEKALEALS